MTTKTTEARRAKFEAAFKDYDLDSFEDDAGTTFFSDTYVQALWLGYNAALDSLCVELPAQLPKDAPYACYEGGWNDMRDEVQDALTTAGIPYK